MEKSIGLGQRLAKRLLPLSLGIGVLIGLGIPAIYYSLEASWLDRSAAKYAQELSGNLQDMILEAPGLWRFQAFKYLQILQRFLPGKEVTTIRILDEEGRPIPGYEYRLSGAEDAWWSSVRKTSAPILFNNRRVGMVEVHVSQRHLIVTTVSLLLLCSTLGVSLALLVHFFPVRVATATEGQIQRLIDDLQRSNGRLDSLLRASQVMASSLSLDRILEGIVHEAAAISGVPQIRLFLLDEDGKTLRCRMGAGVPPGREGDFAVAVGEGLSGQVANTGQPLAVADIREDLRTGPPQRVAEPGLVSYLGVPVKLQEQTFGVLAFTTDTPRAYSDEEINLLSSFAAQAAIAIENARLYGESRRHAEELEARVRERTAELEEALRIKTEFLGKMSHELRTPLNHVIGFSEILKEGMAGPLTPKQATYLDRILTGGKRLLELVIAILDLTEVESGENRFRLETIPLGSLIQEVVGRFEVQIAQKRLTVTTRMDPELRFVVADHGRLGQALCHLLANAVKFTPDGGRVTVTARRVVWSNGQVVDSSQPIDQLAARPIARPEEWVEFAVEDTGIGIPPEARERIFEGFYQVDGSEARKYGGAGVGLTLVRKLVELHGGRVEAESAGPGQGARFVIRLPWLKIPSPRRILLVEDDRILAEALADALGHAGYAVEAAGTGGEALQILGGRPPDLLLLDIGLPDMDGWDILRHVRDTDRTRDLPILVLTGLGNTSTEQAMALGANEFLTKPFSISVLIEVAARLLTRRSATGALTGD